MTEKRYKVADYRQQAERPPYVLELDDGSTVEISQPTTNVILDVAGNTNPRTVLQEMAGDAYDALIAAIGNEPAGVMVGVITDMTLHFRVGEAGAPLT